MDLPGPALGTWFVLLLAAALGAVIVGELVRRVGARFVPLLGSVRPLERILLDLYLGGAVGYGLAVLPVGAFSPYWLPVLALVAVLLIAADLVRSAGGVSSAVGRLSRAGAELLRPGPLLALVAALSLGVVELATALTVPTGNTFDSSVLAFFTAHLLATHSIPLTALPSSAVGIAYPQGTTVWLATYQGLFGLPPARTSLYVTPLFLALGPIGAYAVGDRWLGGERSGAVFALVFAFVGPWSRLLVAGSNDFVFAFPLDLGLLALSGIWVGGAAPGGRDAIAFGLIAGVAAALNPAGPIWLFLALPIAAALGARAFGGRPLRWAMRWGASVVAGAVLVAPSLLEEAVGAGGITHPAAVSGVVPPGGVTGAQFVGLVDPFLFGSKNVWLSPFPVLRAELAALILLGLFVLFVPEWMGARWPALPGFRRLVVGGALGAIGILLAGAVVGTTGSPFGRFLSLTSFAETSILLFALYTMVACVPLAGIASATWPAPSVPRKAPAPPPRPRATIGGPVLSLVIVALLVVPGVAVTTTTMPSYERGIYERFGNVSAADLALLSWSATNLPSGARVLVAPGSAAEFLPGYSAGVVVLFPMVDGTIYNASYRLLVDELTNGTLDAAGAAAMTALDVRYIALTEANSALFRPFEPGPFLAEAPVHSTGRAIAEPGYTIAFEDGPVYLFERTPTG